MHKVDNELNSEEQRRISAALKNAVVNWLQTKDDLVLGILFGSVAAGRANPSSDVDLAVLSSAPLSTERRIELTQELGSALGRSVDLVDLRSASGIIVKELLTEGVVLKNADPDLFANRLLRFYLEPIRKPRKSRRA